MSIIINVQDELAQRLQSAAANRKVSAEELALTILDDAVPSISGNGDWGRCNKRRLELIRKSTRSELSQQEQAELDHLQTWLDEKFQPFDAGLLQQLDEMKASVARVSSEKFDE